MTIEEGDPMRFIWRTVLAGVASLLLTAAGMAEQRIVFMRHGEKPPQGLGQLDCKGLNRALALPAVIAKGFGKPDAIFAPNPADRKTDEGETYDYVRPLATIEPTAIAFGLPVNAGIGFSDAKALGAALEDPKYRDALVLVAWEHKIIVDVAGQLMSDHGGDPADVPKWHGDDFDSVYVVTIDWSGAKPKAKFARSAEGLDGQPETCPH
jgi:hypothetical protein